MIPLDIDPSDDGSETIHESLGNVYWYEGSAPIARAIVCHKKGRRSATTSWYNNKEVRGGAHHQHSVELT